MKSKFERGLIRPEAFLDLHGYNRVDAEKTLEDFIKTCIYKEKRCILIVTGKKKSMLGSKSVLRELVPKWLNENKYFPLVLAHSFAIQRDGGDGARYVLLRKRIIIMSRIANIKRKTKETEIECKLNLDGTGEYSISTGIGFLDHMIEQLSKHSSINIFLKAKGDLHIDGITQQRI